MTAENSVISYVIKNAKVFNPDRSFEKRDVYITGSFFTDTAGDGGGPGFWPAETAQPEAASAVFDAEGLYAIPGLIDIHIHGCMGHDFCHTDADGIQQMTSYLASKGITALCPTTMTLPEGDLVQACQRIKEFADGPDCKNTENKAPFASLAGIHLEGPFISPDKIGAQNPKYIQKPNMELFHKLKQASGDFIKLCSIAPEIEGALDFIEEVSSEGRTICSLAHTTSGYDTAKEAFSRGAKHVTHLHNAMPPFLNRAPGVIGAAFDTPESMVELICDGVHQHPGVVRATFQLFGDDRIMLISDSMMACGLPDGTYSLGGQPVTVSGHTARLQHGDAIAGSVTNLMDCLRTAVRDVGIPLHSAVKCASVNPAKALGLYSERGSIHPGKYADLVLLDHNLNIKKVFLQGRVI